jgi:class 3 adenylate cyclase/pimeloyl-ACP methyl ester carboxylesterase
VEPPETRYADSGGVKIAYQVYGTGPRTLVVVPGFVSNLDLQWTEHQWRRFNERLGSFARVVLYDKAGTGLSDPVREVPTLEQRMADLLAVLGAADVGRAAFLGISEGGPMSLLVAATYPHLVERLALYGTFACGIPDPATNPGGQRWVDLCARMKTVTETWGQGYTVDVFGPTVAGNPSSRRMSGLGERAGATPAMARAAYSAVLTTDVRAILDSVSVPTLVLHRVGDAIPIEGARYIADNVADGRLVELPGSDHYPWIGQPEPLLDQIEEFVTGAIPARPHDRSLTTVMFTDIVGSTDHLVRVGDAAWRQLLHEHDRLTADQIADYRGVLVNSTGDGVLATFDGPGRAIRCADGIHRAVASTGVAVRIGIHTGEVEHLGDNIAGLTVHVAARVAAAAGAGQTLVSSTVTNLVAGGGFEFDAVGARELKGVPGSWELYEVRSAPVAQQGLREPSGTPVPLDD